jgi:prepilin-type N-terminal cleavage/methylation domain-containing protein
MKNLFKKLKIYNRSSGFTLIEMIVAVSIFTIVVFISIGSLLSISDANKKSNSLRTVMDNLNFAMENMSRSIRTGDNYLCNGVGNCPSGKDNFTFTDQNGVSVKYSFVETNGLGMINISKAGGPPLRITSPDVDIDKLSFFVIGVGPNNGQPRVVISIIGVAGIKVKLKSKFSIQTTVSQRAIDS